MKIIITESQYQKILLEQSAPVKIDCQDYDKINTLCSTLVFPKAEADKLIAKYKPEASKKALEKINSLSQKLLSMGGEEGKPISEKFSSAINNSKTEIVKILTQYYPQSVYASCGLGPKINTATIISQICGIIYSNFIKEWNSNWVMRNLANLSITSDNIKEIQLKGKEILNNIINSISQIVNFYYISLSYLKVTQLFSKM